MNHDCPIDKPTEDDCRQCEKYMDTDVFIHDAGMLFMNAVDEYAKTPDGKTIQNIVVSDQFIGFCKFINKLMRGLDQRVVMLDILGVSLDYYPAVQIGVVIGMMVASGGYTPELTHKLLSAYESGDVTGEIEKYLQGLSDAPDTN